MKVLVVDDDLAMRRLLVRLISRHPGVMVREANDGVAALAAIESDTPDLVFTDVRMPHLDGVGLLEILRHNPLFHDLPVVAVSAVSDKSLVLRMVDLGIEDYLLKPLDPTTSAGRLEEILSRIPLRGGARPEPAGVSPVLLLVDNDAAYGDVLRAAFGERLTVVDGYSAAAALEWCVGNRPAIALIAAHQTFPTEEVFARTVRANTSTRVALLVDAVDGAPSDGFDAVVVRSFVPSRLRESLEPLCAAAIDDAAQLRALLAGPLRDILVTACRQSIGLVAGQESTVEPAGEPIADPVVVHAVLAREGGPCVITMSLESSESHVAMLATPAVADGRESLESVAGAVVARLTQALSQRGWSFSAGAPSHGASTRRVDPADGVAELRTEQGARIRASLHLFRESTPSTEEPNAPAAVSEG